MFLVSNNLFKAGSAVVRIHSLRHRPTTCLLIRPRQYHNTLRSQAHFHRPVDEPYPIRTRGEILPIVYLRSSALFVHLWYAYCGQRDWLTGTISPRATSELRSPPPRSALLLNLLYYPSQPLRPLRAFPPRCLDPTTSVCSPQHRADPSPNRRNGDPTRSPRPYIAGERCQNFALLLGRLHVQSILQVSLTRAICQSVD